MGAQVSEAMTGRGRLDAAQGSLKELQLRLRDIDALCAKCKDLIHHDELIRELATVRANFGATLSRATTILDLPQDAADTLAALEKESELVVVFEELVALDAKCAAAQRLFEDGESAAPGGAARRNRHQEHRSRVSGYFGKVDAARETFEERMWAQLKTALHLGDSGAAAVVRVLRVVQEQEAMDAARAAPAATRRRGAAEERAPPRKYRAAAISAVEAAIDERCAKMLPSTFDARSPARDGRGSGSDNDDHGGGGDDGPNIAEMVLDVQECFRALEDIYDFIVPCFPDDYDIWQVMVRRYHARLVFFYDRLAASPGASPANSEILELVRSHEEYCAMLRDLGVPPEWYDIKPVPVPHEPPPPVDTKQKRKMPTGTREAVAAAEADARAKAKEAAAAQGGNWEGSAVVSVDAAARAVLTGIVMDTAGIGVTIGKGLASGTMTVVQGVGNLVTGKGLRGDRAAAASPETVAEAPALPPPPPSAELWTPGCGAGWGHLLDAYVRRMRDSTASWMGNMVAADLELPPQQAEGGKLFTPAGVDFFRIINDQLETVTAVTRGELLVRVVVAVSALLLDFQRLQNTAVERPTGDLSLEVLCAYVNNNERCYDLSKEMLDGLKELAADEEVEQRLEVLEVVEQGFMDTARAAMKKTVDAMFADPGFAGVFAALFGSQDWWSGATCDTLCATVVDYFGDLTVWLTDTFFKRFAEAVMERAVGSYCAALFVQCGSIKTGTMARMAADEAALRDTFAPFVRAPQLTTAFQTLSDLRELACASSEAEIQAAFGTMLTNAPGTTVDVVERILLMRDDIPKPVKKQIVSACSEQWHQRNGTTVGGLAGAAKALGGATLATAEMIQDGIKLALSKNRWFG